MSSKEFKQLIKSCQVSDFKAKNLDNMLSPSELVKSAQGFDQNFIFIQNNDRSLI